MLNHCELEWVVRLAPIGQNKNPSGAGPIYYKPFELDLFQFSLGKVVSSGYRWKIKIFGQVILGVVAVWKANFNVQKLIDFVNVEWDDDFVKSEIQSLHLKRLSMLEKFKNGRHELLSGEELRDRFNHLIIFDFTKIAEIVVVLSFLNRF